MKKPASERAVIPGGATQTKVSGVGHSPLGVVRDWHVVLVAGCNLRCSYCATNFGKFGRPSGVMDLRTAAQLADRIAETLDPEQRETRVSFGGGETFLNFDRFIELADLIRKRCQKRGGHARLSVTTNGVLLDEARLRKLARRRIGLAFSIDGPEKIHDTARRDITGRKTFRRAFGNWSRYRAIIRNLPDAPVCNINCVFGPHSGSFGELMKFWIDQGVPLIEVVAVNHSQFETAEHRRATVRARARYVQGLGEWAREQARHCSASDFLSRYRGPLILYTAWRRLFTGQEKMLCTPGRGMLAVGHDGVLYPCEAYIGLDQRQIGDIFSGIDHKRFAPYVAECVKAEAFCAACDRREACEKPCLALMTKASPRQNVRRACPFAKRVTDLSRKTFEILMNPTAEDVR